MKLSEILESKELTCAVPYGTIGRMLEMIKETEEEGVERAITFCGNGQELSFPERIGKPTTVAPPECLPDKEAVGYFHTHPAGIIEKSSKDWNNDMASRSSISCIGATGQKGLIELSEEPVHRRVIACHRYNTDHPEYKHFKRGLMIITNVVGGVYKQLASKPGPITEEDYKTAMHYKSILDSNIKEGMEKGIISPCDKFSVPDVERMLEEQKL